MPPSGKKVGAKKPQRPRLEEPPLVPYEEERLRKIMRNNARFQQLGIPVLCSMFVNQNSNSHRKNKPCFREDSETEYDPSNDEEDLRDDDTTKGSKETTTQPGVIKLHSKRVFTGQQSTRVTRSKKTATQPDLTLAPRDNVDGHNQATFEAHGFAQFNENTQITNEEHDTSRLDRQIHMTHEDIGHIQADDNMTNGGEGEENNHTDNKDVQLGEKDRWERGINMGHGLHRINRALRGKLQVVVPEGK